MEFVMAIISASLALLYPEFPRESLTYGSILGRRRVGFTDDLFWWPYSSGRESVDTLSRKCVSSNQKERSLPI